MAFELTSSIKVDNLRLVEASLPSTLCPLYVGFLPDHIG